MRKAALANGAARGKQALSRAADAASLAAGNGHALSKRLTACYYNDADVAKRSSPRGAARGLRKATPAAHAKTVVYRTKSEEVRAKGTRLAL